MKFDTKEILVSYYKELQNILNIENILNIISSEKDIRSFLDERKLFINYSKKEGKHTKKGVLRLKYNRSDPAVSLWGVYQKELKKGLK